MPKVFTTKGVEVTAYSYEMLNSYFVGGVMYGEMLEEAIMPFFISPAWDVDKALSLIDHNVVSGRIKPKEFLIIDKGRCWILDADNYRKKIKSNTQLYPQKETE